MQGPDSAPTAAETAIEGAQASVVSTTTGGAGSEGSISFKTLECRRRRASESTWRALRLR
jgi:hypothetical protein